MGPQSGSCGYQKPVELFRRPILLQWVHSLVAVVIRAAGGSWSSGMASFNGSTVW